MQVFRQSGQRCPDRPVHVAFLQHVPADQRRIFRLVQQCVIPLLNGFIPGSPGFSGRLFDLFVIVCNHVRGPGRIRRETEDRGSKHGRAAGDQRHTEPPVAAQQHVRGFTAHPGQQIRYAVRRGVLQVLPVPQVSGRRQVPDLFRHSRFRRTGNQHRQDPVLPAQGDKAPDLAQAPTGLHIFFRAQGDQPVAALQRVLNIRAQIGTGRQFVRITEHLPDPGQGGLPAGVEAFQAVAQHAGNDAVPAGMPVTDKRQVMIQNRSLRSFKIGFMYPVLFFLFVCF